MTSDREIVLPVKSAGEASSLLQIVNDKQSDLVIRDVTPVSTANEVHMPPRALKELNLSEYENMVNAEEDCH